MSKPKPEKAVPSMVIAALQRAAGDVKAAWSQYIIVHYRATGSLNPGCDAKDFYAAAAQLNTGIVDAHGNAVYAGDVLQSNDGYAVIVKRADDGSFYGKLVCDADHSCKDIPYALNDGKDYVKVL